MQIEFEIDQQRLTRTSNAYLIEGSKNFVECIFSFSSDWAELDKWALFKRDNNTYEIFIEDNKCLVPIQCTSAEGEFTVSVVGRKNAENVTGTASDKLLTVRGSEFVGGMGEEGRLTETYLVEVLAEVKALHEKTAASETNAAQSAQEAADSAAAALQSEQNAKASEQASEASKEAAAQSETNSKLSETNSQNSALESAQSAVNAEKSNKSAEKHSNDAGAFADNAALSAQQTTEHTEQVNRDAMQVASDKKSVTELTGQAVKAAGNAQTYMEQAGQIKADTQTITDSALQAMGKLITKAQADINAQGTEIITQATAQADRAQSAADGIRDTADTLQADNEHLKAELKHANRRISVLYDLGKGITHRYETDSETAYSKDVPSGAKVMDVKMVGGKSVVGNHLVQDVKFETRIGDYADRIWKNWGGMNVDVNDGVATFKAEGNWYGLIQNVHVLENHKYYFGCDVKSDIPNNTILAPYIENAVFNEDTFKLTSDQWTHSSKIDVAKKTSGCSIGVRAAGSTTVIGATISCKNIQCIDLTQMFGAGNEPTLEQFEAMLTRPDYPYNAGTLVSADVTAVQVGNKVISLPNSISLKSAGSVYDSLEFYEADGKYYQRHTQRVGVDGDNTYELATPIVTITEIDNRFDAVDVSTGDKITFVGNSNYHLPVPNEQEYLIALNEVTA